MKKNCIFTICSKNFLAQALTLKESANIHEPDTDFYIFLADHITDDVKDLELEKLDEAWIPNWREMAFKYDVVEFNTSIKPFCFKKLFDKNYKNVLYLDPDIYVVDRLNYIWDVLEKKTIILTPHINSLELANKGIISEKVLLFSGIYNLGFVAIKNNEIGNIIVEWWKSKLRNLCYSSVHEDLFVDQKWMIFVPSYYPEEVYVTHHSGINIGYWNLHERELLVRNNKYIIKDISSGQEFPLLLYHFSGFKPNKEDMISSHLPQFNIDMFPTFKPIIKEYKELELKNGYNFYTKLNYSFNEYDNGQSINSLHRRLYRATIVEFDGEDPFSTNGRFYNNLLKSRLLIKERNKPLKIYGNSGINENRRNLFIRFFELLARPLFFIMGVKKYTLLLEHCHSLFYLENQTFLMREMDKIDKNEFYTEQEKKIGKEK